MVSLGSARWSNPIPSKTFEQHRFNGRHAPFILIHLIPCFSGDLAIGVASRGVGSLNLAGPILRPACAGSDENERHGSISHSPTGRVPRQGPRGVLSY